MIFWLLKNPKLCVSASLREYFYQNFIKGKKYYRSFIDFKGTPSVKYNSIHIKNNNIMEFRLFPSEDDKESLMGYIMDSIKLMNEVKNIYSQKYKKKHWKNYKN